MKSHNRAIRFTFQSDTSVVAHMVTEALLQRADVYTPAALMHTSACTGKREWIVYQRHATSLLELSWLPGGLLPKQNASEAYNASQAWQ